MRTSSFSGSKAIPMGSGIWVGIVGSALALGLGLWGLSFPFALERELWWMKSSGYLALGSLFLSLSMTPLLRLVELSSSSRIKASPWISRRRSFGIFAALFGLIHGGLVFFTYLDGEWRVVFSTPYLRAGFVSLAILLALLLTSFPPLTRRLRVRLWKELHRLSYVAAFFLFQHLLLSPFASRRQTFLLFGLLATVAWLRVSGRASGKRVSPPFPRDEAVVDSS